MRNLSLNNELSRCLNSEGFALPHHYHNPEDDDLNIHRCEKFQSRTNTKFGGVNSLKKYNPKGTRV